MHNTGMAKILILNGPNLNLLGTRESAIYGKTTLEAINNRSREVATNLKHLVECHQSNAEHELVHRIQNAKGKFDFIIINPAAFTHTSVALRDAFLAVDIPFIEIHLSNVFAREEFRHHSFLSGIAVGGIYGFGAYVYEMALQAADNYLQQI